MSKRGRPSKPGGKSIWIPPELIELVEALKDGDLHIAVEKFSDWMVEQKKLEANLDDKNKPDVN